MQAFKSMILGRIVKRIKNALSVLTGKALSYDKLNFACHQLSFSQEGEDRVLIRLFEQQKTGFYVDVGAHHPQRFSNTYIFYLKGWRGINIDPLPGSKAKFDSLRPRDINLEIGIACNSTLMTYFSFEDPAYNTFDLNIARNRSSRLLEKHDIPVVPLKRILADYLPFGTAIDFLTIDVEGLDLSILHSNDWARFRPKYVLVEDLSALGLSDLQEGELHCFMKGVGYSLVAKTVNTVFYVDGFVPLEERNDS